MNLCYLVLCIVTYGLWMLCGLSVMYHVTISSMCILPSRNRCAAANARAKRMASGGVTREPHIVASHVLPSVAVCTASLYASSVSRTSGAGLPPCKSIHQCEGPIWPWHIWHIGIVSWWDAKEILSGRGASPKSQSTRSSSSPRVQS